MSKNQSDPKNRPRDSVFGSEGGNTVQEHVLAGRIIGLVVMTVPEFGTRASFKLERAGQSPVTCSVAGDVAREFIISCCEGDMVAVRGVYEPRPSTASSKTPWPGRFRVRALRVLEAIRFVRNVGSEPTMSHNQGAVACLVREPTDS